MPPLGSAIQGRPHVIEVVNGYLCMNCCDVDKARLGQDPHQSTNQIQKSLEQDAKRNLAKSPTAGRPASGFGPSVIRSGALANSTNVTTGIDTGQPAVANATTPQPSGASILDILI